MFRLVFSTSGVDLVPRSGCAAKIMFVDILVALARVLLPLGGVSFSKGR